MSLRTTILTSALASAVVLASCGGTNKKKTNYAGEAGAAGAAGAPEELSGGAGDSAGAAGAAGSQPEGGMAGETSVPPEAGSAGEAGAPPVVVVPPPLPTVLFTVAPGATGLAGTAIAAQAHPESVIFGSTTANVDPISGTNTVMVTAAQLGIADGDVISAFALPQAAPSAATYAFSIAGPGTAGAVPTRLARSAADHEAPGDVYFSDGIPSYRYIGGESGDRSGYNALIADEQTLGLSFTPHGETLDDLTGIQLLPSGVLSTAIYFAVSAGSAGLPGTAVAAAPTPTRGCTVFKSNLDGTNSAVMSCAALGLADAAQLQGLTIYSGAEGVTEILFTLDANSTGLVGTAVSSAAAPTTSDGPHNVQNNIYASTGDGSNGLRVAGNRLGLLHDDAIDAVAVYDRAATYYGHSAQCTLTPSPETVQGGNLSQFQSAHGLGDHLLLLNGETPSVGDQQSDVVAAYDVTTCAFVASATLPFSTLGSGHWAPVPLAGWSAADPLKNLEYWQLDPGDGQSVIHRFSASGANLNTYAFEGLVGATLTPDRLDYDPAHQRMFASVDPGGDSPYYDRISFALPAVDAPNSTVIPVLRTQIPHPCAYRPQFSGVDAAGDSVYAQYDQYGANASYRVCSLTVTGELADLPATWQAGGYPSWALLVPGVALYSLSTYPGYTVDSHPLGTAPIVNVQPPTL